MRTATIIIAVVVVLAAMHAAAPLLVPLLVATLVAIAFQPVTDWLTRRGLSALIATVVTMIVVVGLLGLFGYLCVLAVQDLAASTAGGGGAPGSLRDQLATWLRARRLGGLATTIEEARVGARLGDWLQGAVITTGDVALAIVNVLIVIAFIHVDLGKIRRKAALVLGVQEHERAGRAVHDVQRYLQVKLLLATINGVALGLWCWAWGLSNPILWGVLSFALNFVPILGSILAAIPPTLIAALTLGIGPAFGVLSGFVAANILIDNLLQAQLLGRTLDLSPLVVILVLLIWAFVLGPVGAILAVPITVVIRIALDHHPRTRWLAALLAGEAHHYDDLASGPAAIGSGRPAAGAGDAAARRPAAAPGGP